MEQLATIAVAATLIVGVALVALLGSIATVVVKTKLPGRIMVFLSVVVLSSFVFYEHFIVGGLSLVLGPIGVLYSAIIYSFAGLLFCVGFSRMCWHFLKVERLRNVR